MATQLRIKRGTTNANAPSGLTAGEMAINLVDKKLYVGGTAGTNVVFLDSTSSVGLSTANTFTQLNTFSAGISASGATFTGSISGATATFSKDITVNSMTVGLGKSPDTTNVAIGSGALASNTSDFVDYGISNVAVGGYALTANTTGSYNTAIGGQALTSNTTGTSNTALGGGALASNTIGDDNIAIGYNALVNSSTASSNIAIGALALANGSLGSFNIGIGFETLGAAGNTGNSNVAVGYQSLKTNTTGSNNTGIGTSALLPLTTGSQMTALGYNAGRYRGTATATNTTGTGGIYIGYQARASAAAQTNEIVIGVNALGLGSHTAVIGATLQSAATIYGLLNLPSGLSASGATFMGNIKIPVNTTGAITIGTHASKNLTLGSIDSVGEIVQVGNSTATLNIRQASGGIVSIGDYNGTLNSNYISVDDTNDQILINGAEIQLNGIISTPLTLSSTLSAAGATFTGPIISTGYQISSGAINAQTASYGLTGSDNGKIVTMNVATANTLTVPAGLGVGFNCTAIQLGAGQTTITTSAGVTLNSYQGYLKISGQHGSASIVSYASNVYNVAGSLSA